MCFFPREAWVWPFYSSQVVYSLGETTLAGVWWFNGHTPVNVPLQSSLLLGRATWSKWDYMWPAEANETCETWKWTICQMHLQDHRCQLNIWKCKWGRWQHACERGKPRETSHHVKVLFITIQELKLQRKEWKNISLNKGLHRLHWACAPFLRSCFAGMKKWSKPMAFLQHLGHPGILGFSKTTGHMKYHVKMTSESQGQLQGSGENPSEMPKC